MPFKYFIILLLVFIIFSCIKKDFKTDYAFFNLNYSVEEDFKKEKVPSISNIDSSDIYFDSGYEYYNRHENTNIPFSYMDWELILLNKSKPENGWNLLIYDDVDSVRLSLKITKLRLMQEYRMNLGPLFVKKKLSPGIYRIYLCRKSDVIMKKILWYIRK